MWFLKSLFSYNTVTKRTNFNGFYWQKKLSRDKRVDKKAKKMCPRLISLLALLA